MFASESIGNLFYLHAAIFEISKQCFIINPPVCWCADVSIKIYELSLLFSLILYLFPTHVLPVLFSLATFFSMLRQMEKTGINLFLATVPILYPLKTQEKQRFSCVFRGYKIGTIGQKGVKGALTQNGSIISRLSVKITMRTMILSNLWRIVTITW